MRPKRHPPYRGEDIVCSAWKHAEGVWKRHARNIKVKHMIGITRNETSRRYVDEEPEFFMPEVWRGRPEGSIKQGSSGAVQHNHYVADLAERLNAAALVTYHEMLNAGVAPEQARMVLPQSMMTEWIETASLAAVCRSCKLRLDPHAQAETREVAEQIAEVVAPMFPVSWAALMA